MRTSALLGNRSAATYANSAVADRLRRADLVNVALLLAAFGVVLLLVPPSRDFPINDDWAYAQSVSEILRGTVRPHDFAMATSLGSIAWGALFSLLLGESFTTLSISTLVLSAAGVVLFYALLRQLNVTPTTALLGTATLALNPMYIYLSYAFMTDLTFLVFSLAALFCYTYALRTRNPEPGTTQLFEQAGVTVRSSSGKKMLLCLGMGSIFASLAYLTRQPGVALPVSALAFLWLSRQWSLSRAGAICLVPVLVAVVAGIWERTFPPPLVSYLVTLHQQTLFLDLSSYLLQRWTLLVSSLFLVGLAVLPLLVAIRKPLWILVVWSIFLPIQVLSQLAYGSFLPGIYANTVGSNGFLMHDYPTAPLFEPWVWALLSTISAVAMSVFLVWLIQRTSVKIKGMVKSWRSQGSWRSVLLNGLRTDDPAAILYLFGAFVAAGTVVVLFTYALMDRYWLPVLPALMLPLLRAVDRSVRTASGDDTNMADTERTVTQQSPGARGQLLQLYGWRWIIVAGIAVLSIGGQQDYMARATARWSSAEQVVASGVPHNRVSAGIEWAGWYLYEDGAEYVRRHTALDKGELPGIMYVPYATLDAEYSVSETSWSGYTQVGSVPYSSWFRGANRQVLILHRDENSSLSR